MCCIAVLESLLTVYLTVAVYEFKMVVITRASASARDRDQKLLVCIKVGSQHQIVLHMRVILNDRNGTDRKKRPTGARGGGEQSLQLCSCAMSLVPRREMRSDVIRYFQTDMFTNEGKKK